MDKRIEKLKKFREFLILQISELSAEQLNHIPKGYNNNIIWNITHLICAQQGICYLRAALPALVPEKYITPFFTNTKPDRFINDQEIDEIKQLYLSTIDQFALDYEKNIFRNYTPSPNIFKMYGVRVNTIDDALEFLLFHEGYHSGVITALKRLV